MYERHLVRFPRKVTRVGRKQNRPKRPKKWLNAVMPRILLRESHFWRHVFFPTTTFQTVTFQTQLSRPPSFQTIQLSRLPIFQTIAILSSFPDLDSRFSRLIQIYFFNLLFLKLKNAAFRETAIPLKHNGRLDAFFHTPILFTYFPDV